MPRDDSAASLEFEGGVTRRGKLVLGVLSCVLLYALGVPKEGLALCACGFGYWAFAYGDIADQHTKFQAAAAALKQQRAE